MTKPETAAQRAADWTFNLPAGTALHEPTGVLFRFYPHWHAVLDDPINKAQEGDVVPVEGEPWVFLGLADMPEDVADKRPRHLVADGDANAPGLQQWVVIAPPDQLQRAREVLAKEHGQEQARAMLRRIARKASEGWIFRARLERGWSNGQRAT